MKKLFTADVNLHSDNRRCFQLQNCRSTFVATFGFNQSVEIFDRHGERKLELPLPGEPVSMSWDADGDNLAVIDDKTSSATIWNSLSFKISQLHTGMKDTLSVLSWSKVGSRLAIGTSKGNLVIYNHKNLKKTSLLGKHTRKITCAVWNRKNTLALASEDKSITINSAEGDLMKHVLIHDLPTNLDFGQMKLQEVSRTEDNTVSCIVGRKQLFLLNLDDIDNPIELAFRQAYGDLIAYQWFGDGYIIVGFSNGYFVVVSTQSSEIGKEIYQIHDHKDGLHDISVCTVLNRCATVGDHCVKIHDLQNIRELTAIIELEEKNDEGLVNRAKQMKSKLINNNLFTCQLQWSDDGQLMAISTPQKLLHVFLSQLPMLAALSPPNSTGLLARLTSLLEVTVEPIPCIKNNNLLKIYSDWHVLKIEIEPTFIGLGQKYLSVGINNRAWFYELTNSDIVSISEYDYLTTVDQISLNENYAAACGPDGKLTLHWINPKTFPDKSYSNKKQSGVNDVSQGDVAKVSRDSCIFPQSSSMDSMVTSFKLTNDFLIYSTNKGKLLHFNISNWNYANSYHHNCAILHIFPNSTGTRVAFIDDTAMAFIYNPINDQLIEIPEFCPSTNNILWDLEDTENPLLIAYDNLRISVYRYFMNEYTLLNTSSTQQTTGKNVDSSTATDSNCINNNISGNHNVTGATFGKCHLVGVMRLPYGHLPLCIVNGELCMLSPTGRLLHQTLTTHQFRVYAVQQENKSLHRSSVEQIKCNTSEQKRSTKKDSDFTGGLKKLSFQEIVTYFEQAVKAGCFEDAEIFVEQLDSHHLWSQLGMSCLRVMKFDMAIRCFRSSKDPGLVLAVQRIQKIEDRFLLAGYIAMILKEFDDAQELFLASTEPIAALEMRRDLLHWEDALQLARKLALKKSHLSIVNMLLKWNVPETTDEYVSLRNSEQRDFQSKDHGEGEDEWSKHVSLCNAGIARNTIRLGDFKRGIELSVKSGNSSLQRECADILEQHKQWQESANLYEVAGCYESAVIVNLKCKNYKKAGDLLNHVTNAPWLHLQYAKAREADGAYKEAITAYETANDLDSVVRLQLEKLNNPEEAIRILHKTHSIESAKMIAQYFIQVGDQGKAIQFLVIKHKKMELYAEVIGSDASISEYQSIACYFENEKNWYLAGKYYLLAKQYEKAIRHLLHVPYTENSPALDLALEAVGQAGDSRLTHLVIVYLMGETDGVAKDARHLFRLYMVLKQYKEAARTAVIIAREEQTNGNYRSAHDLLFSMVQELRQRNIRVPSEMSENLALLHSYILAKVHVKNGDHLRGARMLIRVSENISKFPSHVVPILTSTVIECQKAGLKSASFSYAAMLLRPEYRDKLDMKYRRKFETLIRRQDLKTDCGGDQTDSTINKSNSSTVETSTPCPSCGSLLLETCLYCTECRSNIPYCVITGNHVVKNDFTVCPGCQFPALYSELMRYVENCSNPVCPMCNVNLSRDSIRRLIDSSVFLNQSISSLNADLIENDTNEKFVELNGKS
ncbi:unnamed protein product [Heterobilharzia americana]|nr:unnamed protein product [Heterobilharzia americana]